MNGYVESGYLVVLGTLGGYAVSLVTRERAPPAAADAGSATPGSDTVFDVPGVAEPTARSSEATDQVGGRPQ